MDFQRLSLFFALSIVLFLIYEAWQKDYGMPVPVTATAPVQSAPGTPGVSPGIGVPAVAPTVSASAPATAAAPVAPALQHGQRIHVRTDVLDVVIDTVGGDIREVELPKYPVSVDKPHQPFKLMEDSAQHFFVAQSGFTQPGGSRADPCTAAPNHTCLYQAERTTYSLSAGQDTLQVDLHWKSPTGVSVTKRYIFARGSYLIKMDYEVHNGGAQPWRAVAYDQLQRSEPTTTSRFVHTYTGGVLYSPEDKYQKISFKDMEKHPLSRAITGGWVAMIQHYFLGAWVPGAKAAFHYYTQSPGDDRYTIGFWSPEYTVAPGQTSVLDGGELFVGPKLQKTLAAIAPGLDLTVDYGYLTVLAKPIYWLMEQIHKLTGNWGWSIVLLTMLIKLAFYKLSETSYKSMANMRRVQPRLAALKDRYGDDRQKLNQAMMDLYKKEKINPLGGCLPIAIQIPVFIALYWVLLESVELRQADWILWIHDLSTKDPYFILPVIMGVTMLVQQRLNPSPVDPIQAKVMMVLPLVFTVFFAFFPAGLVLYWVVNNSLSILQQWYITRIVIKA